MSLVATNKIRMWLRSDTLGRRRHAVLPHLPPQGTQRQAGRVEWAWHHLPD